MANNHNQGFIKLFNEIAPYHNRYEVFRDFVTMASISIHNAVAPSETLEDKYMRTVKRYRGDDPKKMVGLLSELTIGLDRSFGDFLGGAFMELGLGESRMGQFFTPYSVSKMMASMLYSEDINNSLDKEFITLSEPSCGAGGMVIAFAEAMLDQGANPQRKLWVSCIDVDHVAAMMCYLQLSLLHIPAEVVTGNTLTMQYSRVMKTPAHHLGLWDYRLQADKAKPDSQVENIEVKLNKPTPSAFNIEQLSLFELA